MVLSSRSSPTWCEHLGHTSFVIGRGGLQVLIDPILIRQDLDFRRPTCPRWFFADTSQFDAVFISHGHNDHLHPPSLLALSPEAPIYFMDENPETCSCTPAEDPRHLLPGLGFKDIRPFRPGDRVELAGEVTVHVLPARSSSEGEEQCCFLIETPDVLILDAVDIKDDPVTREALEEYRGRVDLAFVPTGAALQFQGFWNQMDAVDALEFCEWLRPAKVATCGGAVSLSEKARLDSLERYPADLADWLVTAGDRMPGERLLRQRPPCRVVYESGRLLSCTPVSPEARFRPRNGSRQPHAVVATLFTGYHPRLPTKRLVWPGDSLQEWLGTLQVARDVLRHAEGDLEHLLRRCKLAMNRTPAATLSPCLLRRLIAAGELALGARISAHLPEPPAEPSDLEMSYFAVLEAQVEGSGLAGELLEDLRTCLWIDRSLFHLRNLHLRLRALVNVPESEAEALRARHIEDLLPTFDRRRPLLGPHHIRLDRPQIRLLTGEEPAAGTAELLCYANPQGVFQLPLSPIESTLLSLCDGRQIQEIAAEAAERLEIPAEEVKAALFKLLGRLAQRSVLLVDWSR